jgi:hypothetical protein
VHVSPILSPVMWCLGLECFLLISVLVTALWCNSADNTPTPSDSVCDSSVNGAWPVARFCSARGGLKCSVQVRCECEPTVWKIQKESLQQDEGHLLPVPYCTNHRNELLYSFLSPPTHYIWPHSPQHRDKPAPPWNLNIVMNVRTSATAEEVWWHSTEHQTVEAIWKE